MKILVVGGGGREHALTWKLASHTLWTAPGNAGTPNNLALAADDLAGLEAWVKSNPVDLVVVGPEGPLAAGLADRLPARVFGPSQKAAEIESSKAFAKDFMVRHGIPTARHASFQNFDQARDYLGQVDYPVVLKASGLAAGKGVLLPDSVSQARGDLESLRQFGEEVVIEERLEGREVSLMAFCDGERVRPMPAAVDHKRLHDHDLGPNTGGMGAYAPDPRSSAQEVLDWTALVLEPAVRGLAREGRPFRGVLYAGLMLTARGPRVLEFNCRFGDPETQVVLPLLESDLAEVLQACAEGCLDRVDLRWSQQSAACVVLTAQGYPGKVRSGDPIEGLEEELEGTLVFQAGTAFQGRTVSSGGRVLGVTGLGESLEEALRRAYGRAQRIRFEGCHYRRDIGRLVGVS